MGRFFKNILSSCLGVLLFMLLLFVTFIIIGLASSSKPSYKNNSVLKLNLSMAIPEKSNNVSQYAGFFDQNSIGLDKFLDLIERAETDDKIKGIVLEPGYPQVGMAKALTIRQALEEFKSSGKFVYSYGSNYSQSGYYIASIADSVFLNPNGMLDLKGIGVSMPYFKEIMDELGISMNIYYAGQFKSATEPFRRTDMSEQNRLQLREYITEVYDNFLLDIAKSRKISVETVDDFAADFAGFTPENTLEAGLVDKLLYKDGLTKLVQDRLALDEKKKIAYVDLKKYQQVSKDKKSSKSKDKIAIVVAEGDIVDAGKEKGMISSEKYIEVLTKIRNKKSIKAVVLRINSGGGSGFASDEIWREIELIKEAGKPVVVSMGDYAASGGYYIACNADSIVASPNSLTGSIGVFAMIPNLAKMSEEKLKIHFDSVKTHPFATAFNPFYEFSPEEDEKIQNHVDMFYELFLSRVAAGRDMTRDEVHAIAQGRIWTGRKAKEIGLVDELGELEKAVEIASELADLESYSTSTYPKFKVSFMEEMIKNMDLEASIPGLKYLSKLEEIEPYSDILFNEESFGKAQMLLPVKIDVK